MAFVAAGITFSLFLEGRDLARAERNQSWLARFEAQRQAHPQATTFVYAESEFQRDDFDKLESLRMAIPNHVVISPAWEIRKWPFTPVNHMMREDYLAAIPQKPWLSDAATALLQSPP